MVTTLAKPSSGVTGWAATINGNFTAIETQLDLARSLLRPFGDGSDGDVTISSLTTLTDDKCYRNLTVNAELRTGGLRIYASESVTIGAAGSITNSGGNGAAGAGGQGALGFVLGYGGDGGFGFSGSDAFDSFGGDGGDASSSGGTANRPSAKFGSLRSYVQAIIGYLLSNGDAGGGFNSQIGGGAGGGGGTGGGGGGGGPILIATPRLVVTGSILAQGGNGNGTGGGGGGGVIILLYGSKTGAGTVSVAAGTGGTGAQAGTIFELTRSAPLSLTKPAAGSTNWGTPVNQNFTDIETFLNRNLLDLPGLFGDASDGNVTLTAGVTTTLTRDMFYGTLTVPNTAVLNTAGFRVFARTSITVASGGQIHNNGVLSAAGTANSVGGGAGPFTDTINSLGGDGGAGDSGAGGVAFDATSDYGKARGLFSAMTGLFFTTTENVYVTGGAGGGPGSSGSGGGGGGVVLLATPTLSNAGAIEARGGNGAGGGGGGGGGVIFLACGSKTGAGSVSVAGGTGNVAGATGTIVDGTA